VDYSRSDSVVTDLFHECDKRVGVRIVVQVVAVDIVYVA